LCIRWMVDKFGLIPMPLHRGGSPRRIGQQAGMLFLGLIVTQRLFIKNYW